MGLQFPVRCQFSSSISSSEALCFAPTDAASASVFTLCPMLNIIPHSLCRSPCERDRHLRRRRGARRVLRLRGHQRDLSGEFFRRSRKPPITVPSSSPPRRSAENGSPRAFISCSVRQSVCTTEILPSRFDEQPAVSSLDIDFS